MKTTLELPDDLMREIKVRAAREDRKLKDLVAELLRLGLEQHAARKTAPQKRVQLPLIKGGRRADPDREMTPGRVAEVLLEQEVRRALGR